MWLFRVLNAHYYGAISREKDSNINLYRYRNTYHRCEYRVLMIMFVACVLFNFKNDQRNRQQKKASRRGKILSAELLLDILVRSSISRNYLGTSNFTSLNTVKWDKLFPDQ